MRSTLGRSSSCFALFNQARHYCKINYTNEPRLTLGNTLVEVLMVEQRGAFPQCDHSGLDTNSLQLRTIELVRTPRQFLEVDAWPHSHLPTMYPENLHAAFFSGQREFNLSI